MNLRELMEQEANGGAPRPSPTQQPTPVPTRPPGAQTPGVSQASRIQLSDQDRAAAAPDPMLGPFDKYKQMRAKWPPVLQAITPDSRGEAASDLAMMFMAPATEGASLAETAAGRAGLRGVARYAPKLKTALQRGLAQVGSAAGTAALTGEDVGDESMKALMGAGIGEGANWFLGHWGSHITSEMLKSKDVTDVGKAVAKGAPWLPKIRNMNDLFDVMWQDKGKNALQQKIGAVYDTIERHLAQVNNGVAPALQSSAIDQYLGTTRPQGYTLKEAMDLIHEISQGGFRAGQAMEGQNPVAYRRLSSQALKEIKADMMRYDPNGWGVKTLTEGRDQYHRGMMMTRLFEDKGIIDQANKRIDMGVLKDRVERPSLYGLDIAGLPEYDELEAAVQRGSGSKAGLDRRFERSRTRIGVDPMVGRPHVFTDIKGMPKFEGAPPFFQKFGGRPPFTNYAGQRGASAMYGSTPVPGGDDDEPVKMQSPPPEGVQMAVTKPGEAGVVRAGSTPAEIRQAIKQKFKDASDEEIDTIYRQYRAQLGQ